MEAATDVDDTMMKTKVQIRKWGKVVSSNTMNAFSFSIFNLLLLPPNAAN